MRCFIAVDLAPELKEKIIKLQSGLKMNGIKLVEPENFHFTLKFLGEIDESMISSITEHLDRVASTTRPFTIHISGVSSFPNDKVIRVVWIGADNKDRDFLKLHEKIDCTLTDVSKNEKPVPHLTLARVGYANMSDIQKFISNNKNTEIGEMSVDRIKLKKSTLTGKGPVYEDLEEWKLK